jgi:hypothetical protein
MDREHQQSRRVGPPIPMQDRRGILVEPLTWILIGIAYSTAAFWGIVYTINAGAPDSHWF